MNDTSTSSVQTTHDAGLAKIATLAQQRSLDTGDEARAYLDNATRMLALVRQGMDAVAIRALKAKSALKHRYQDELNRIEAEQHRDFTRLANMEHKILAMQEEHG